MTPGEAHWYHGAAESAVRIVKRTMKRLREQDNEMSPVMVGLLAVEAENNLAKVNGFSPTQWAYGRFPEDSDNLIVNATAGLKPEDFWKLQRWRLEAEKAYLEENSRDVITRLRNSASRPIRQFARGDWVCAWRVATARAAAQRAKKRGEEANPEPRYFGPGRVALVEPSVHPDGRESIVWVIMGTGLWRCAAEHCRHATEAERTQAMLDQSYVAAKPLEDLIRNMAEYEDITKQQLPNVEDLRDLPAVPSDHGRPEPQPMDAVSEVTEFPRAEAPDDLEDVGTWLPQAKRHRTEAETLDGPEAAVPAVQQRVADLTPGDAAASSSGPAVGADVEFAGYDRGRRLDGLPKRHARVEASPYPPRFGRSAPQGDEHEREALHAVIEQQEQEEQQLLKLLVAATITGDEACFIEVEIKDIEAFCAHPLYYMKKTIVTDKSREVTFRHLSGEHKKLFEEAMAREVNEVLEGQALRALHDEAEVKQAEWMKERCIDMRWILTWKAVEDPVPPPKGEPTVLTRCGEHKAKARVVLIGYKHPDLVKKNPYTHRPELETASPTLSKVGRNMILQGAALDEFEMESADAKSAFIQADRHEEKNQIWVRVVNEISRAMGIAPVNVTRLLGAIYGLTTAPRTFWKDADKKMRVGGFATLQLDRCIWTFSNSAGEVVGRVGTHVDDFLITGKTSDPEWQKAREYLSTMYKWSPWRKGKFIFAGVELMQLTNYSIILSQEDYCDKVDLPAISATRSSQDDAALTSNEISLTRGLLMKAQWRAVQSAPQLCARVGLANTALALAPTVARLKEALKIVKELKKSSKETLIFHAFNQGRKDKLKWHELVQVTWADAGKGNRSDGSSTGGLVIAMAAPEIMSGRESPVSMLDWRSWKLDRKVVGTNGAEAQAVYEGEDKGWKCRVLWANMNGVQLLRGEQNAVAALMKSLLIMDSKGFFDACTRQESAQLGMKSAQDGVEALAVHDATQPETQCTPTWCPGDLNLADMLTKDSVESRKVSAL